MLRACKVAWLVRDCVEAKGGVAARDANVACVHAQRGKELRQSELESEFPCFAVAVVLDWSSSRSWLANWQKQWDEDARARCQPRRWPPGAASSRRCDLAEQIRPRIMSGDSDETSHSRRELIGICLQIAVSLELTWQRFARSRPSYAFDDCRRGAERSVKVKLNLVDGRKRQAAPFARMTHLPASSRAAMACKLGGLASWTLRFG